MKSGETNINYIYAMNIVEHSYSHLGRNTSGVIMAASENVNSKWWQSHLEFGRRGMEIKVQNNSILPQTIHTWSSMRNSENI